MRAHFAALPGLEAHVKIVSDLGDATLGYELDYVYDKQGADTFTLTAPAALAGIEGALTGTDEASLELRYDGLALDDAMPQRPGLTPADALFGLLADLRTAQPAQQWEERVEGETLLVLRYEGEDRDGTIQKQVWLTQKELRPVCAELYADGTRVLFLQVTDYRER